MTLNVKTSQGDYDILIESGSLHRAGEVFNLNRKVLLVTDSGVPEEYAMTVASQCEEAVLFVFEQGEESKCMDTYVSLLQTMAVNLFTRTDCVVAVGGGVVGDVAGFAAATYMRGIDFYNIPTTVLSQVDSSIGGKTSINFGGYKNQVGAFWPPKGVLIDSDVLRTLPERHIANGFSEAIKMALTHDADLLLRIEESDSVTEEIILGALNVKKQVVEADEHECGLRRVLNFGHTLGHAIESVCDTKTYYHGECVAIGMLPMCSADVKERLLSVLEKHNLPTEYCGDVEALLDSGRHDKKVVGDTISVVYVPAVGRFEIKTIAFSEYEMMIREALGR